MSEKSYHDEIKKGLFLAHACNELADHERAMYIASGIHELAIDCSEEEMSACRRAWAHAVLYRSGNIELAIDILSNDPASVADLADKIYFKAKGSDEERRNDYLAVVNFIAQGKGILIAGGFGGEALRRSGWAHYFLGNLANPENNQGIIIDTSFYEAAIADWEEGFLLADDPEVRNGILNGLPLALRWIVPEDEIQPENWFALDAQTRINLREVAYLYSFQGIKEAKASNNPGLVAKALNTRIILLREDKQFEEAIKLADQTFQLAFEADDFITAGQASQNEGDTLRLFIKELIAIAEKAGEDVDAEDINELHQQAYIAYAVACGMYIAAEEDGKSCKKHFEAAKTKAEEEAAEIKRY